MTGATNEHGRRPWRSFNGRKEAFDWVNLGRQAPNRAECDGIKDAPTSRVPLP
jgi:hypothetical protein